MFQDIITWFEQASPLLQALAAGTAILGFSGAVMWGLFRFLRWLLTKPKPVLVEATIKHADELPRLTPVQWLRTQEAMRESIIAELNRADDEERKRLQGRIDELTARINNPEGAFEAERKRLADLEDKLVREGNELGAERLDSAIEKLRAGNTDEAEAIFAEIATREAMAVQRAARAEFGLGEIAESKVQWAAASQHYARAAELDPSYDTLLRAGNLLWRAGQYEAALDVNKRLVALSKEEFGAHDPKTATAINNYAALLKTIGRSAAAEPLFREALKIGRETLGDRHPDMATRLNNLAGLLKATGRYGEAEPLYREALEIWSETLGDRHPDTARSLNNLAGLLEATGRVAEAEPLYREALEIGRETLGDRHPAVAIHLNNLAGFLRATGRVEEAKPFYRDALEIGRHTLGDRHPDVAISINNLAGLLRETGRAKDATPLFVEALGIFREALGDDHSNTQKIARNTLIHLREYAPDHPDRAALEAIFGAPDEP